MGLLGPKEGAQALGRPRRPSSPDRDASSIRMDTLEVPHLLHKDEPHVRRFSQLHCRLHLFDYINARQKFLIRVSSGNLVIYNSRRSCLWGEKFCFATPYSYNGLTENLIGKLHFPKLSGLQEKLQSLKRSKEEY